MRQKMTKKRKADIFVVFGDHADKIQEKEHHHRRAAHRGNHDGQRRAHPVIEIGEHDVGRDHDDDIRNDQRRHHGEKDNAAAREVDPREPVSGQSAHEHPDQHGRNDVHKGIQEGAQHHRLLKHRRIVLSRPLLREKAGQIDLLRRFERGRKQIDKRNDDERRHDGEHGVLRRFADDAQRTVRFHALLLYDS